MMSGTSEHFEEYDDEYFDEEYEMREDTPTQQLRDVQKDDKEDTRINAIKVLTYRSYLPHWVLDSGANRHIFNNEALVRRYQLTSPHSNDHSHQRTLRFHHGNSSMCYR